MGGKSGFRSYPRHLGKPRMRGLMVCDASGFVRHVDEAVEDVRQGTVAREFADITPGFGTHHPQDVVQLGVLDDPTPSEQGDHIEWEPKSKQDLGISDAEILASIREGRPPRRGCK
jgi:hypothetical protein